MEPKFNPSLHEQKIYEFWEKSYLSVKKGKPYTILMPPPNANASLHAGHGMYIIDDIIIRYKRLRGFAALWIPGVDHAGFETQYVYEKYLAKQGKSRMDYDRQTFYNNIFQFVKDNSGLIFKQFKRLGFLADWTRSVFTLDEQVLKRVFKTFKKMHDENLVYRDNYMVNYCVNCGTTLAELEVAHQERIDPLYYIKYGPFVLATVRPETKFGDTAVAVHPRDKRYKKWIGRQIEVEGLNGKFKLKVIADEIVDPQFGTGVIKVTPAHDPNDFEIGKRHNLEFKKIIDLRGRLNDLTGVYKGLKVKEARKKIAEDLAKKGLIEKIDDKYIHTVAVCYKCKKDLEPSIMPNWFIKVADLKKPVIEAVKKERVKFYPKKYKKQMLDWLKIMHDWPISRQIVWGIRIPAWYKIKDNSDIFVSWIDKEGKPHQGSVNSFLDKKINLKEIKKGLQKVYASVDCEYTISAEEPAGDMYLPETDTFDTWFSSGQWPLATLKEEEYETRFPTDMMGTLEDILKLWISRMIMFSLYLKQEVPFGNVYLWSMVADAKGIKMSKSKGNVINPLSLVEKHGADAFRASLIFGTSQGGKVILSEDKIIGMRNFMNKIWNIGRFIYLNTNHQSPITKKISNSKLQIVQNFKKEFLSVKKKYFKYMDSYQFSKAFGLLYEFLWHKLADFYIERLKDQIKNGKIETAEELKRIYLQILVLLHPFIPFVTEAVWKIFCGEEKSILDNRIKN